MYEDFQNGYKPEQTKAPDTPPPAPTTMMAEAQTGERSPIDALYPSMDEERPSPPAGVPEEVQALRKQALEENPAQRMYPPEKQLTAVPDNAFDEVPDLTPEARQGIVEEIRRMAADASLGNADIQGLISRARALHANPIPPEQQADMTMRNLRRQFGGEEGAAKALADARALLNRDPRAKQMILAMGLGDDSATIVSLAKQAARERNRGRLK
jgi:hypothetical protein